MVDYYATLGLTRSAAHDGVVNAYRTAALKHHPNKCEDKDADAKEVRVLSGVQDAVGRPIGHESCAGLGGGLGVRVP